MNGSNAVLFALIVLLLALGIHGCLLESEDNCGRCSPILPSRFRPVFDSVPDTAVVDQRRYTLQSYIWRDFMPGNPCTKLTVIVRLLELDSLRLPAGISMDYVWIRHGNSWWNAAFTKEERPPYPPHIMERVARCGPKWQTGDPVDVIVQVRFGDSVEVFLRKDSVLIQRTE